MHATHTHLSLSAAAVASYSALTSALATFQRSATRRPTSVNESGSVASACTSSRACFEKYMKAL
jgi:hypothetical protein